MRQKIGRVLLVLMLMLSSFNFAALVHGEENKKRYDIVDVWASGDDGNVIENTLDNISSTRWASKADKEPQWAVYDLGEEKNVAKVGISFNNGDVRRTIFDIEVSNDKKEWVKLLDQTSTPEEKATNDLVGFDVKDTTARYVRFTGYGYEFYDESKGSGDWISIFDFHIYGNDSDPLDPTLNIEQEQRSALTYTQPGLVNADGSDHAEPVANVATTTIDVTKNGVDTSENDQSTAIQKLIDEAEVGTELYFPNGTYTIVEYLKMKDGVNLRGESREGTIFMATPSDSGYNDMLILMLGVEDVVISDITITADLVVDYEVDHTVNNPNADGLKVPIRIRDREGYLDLDTGIQLNKPSKNILIKNVLIEKYQTMGIRVENSSDVVIDAAIFQNAMDLGGVGAGYGVSIQGAGNNRDRTGFSNDSKHNVVKNSQFIGPYLRHGVILQYYTHNNAIYNNVLTETKLDAIDIHGEDEYLNEIYGNTIKDIKTGAGIAAGNTGATHDKSGPGNYIHDNTISNSREGIKIHLGTEDTIIENNTIIGSTVPNAKGIYLQNAPGTRVTGNTIKDNQSAGFYSVYMDYDNGTAATGQQARGFGIPYDIIIEDNTFDNNTNGVYISSGRKIEYDNNTFTNISDQKIVDTRTKDYKESMLPTEILDLTNWKINTARYDESGTKPVEVKQPELEEFFDEDFYYVNAEQTGVVFNAPVDGATTPNSNYPRTELREMKNGGTEHADWSTAEGKHTMVIDQMVTSLPAVKNEVTVGQIHDADDDVVMIRLEAERLFVQAEGVDLGTLESNYQLGTRFQVKIEAMNNIVYVYYNGELKVEYPVEKHGNYFKAGMYTQSNLSKGDIKGAYGEVVIFGVTLEHDYDNVPTEPEKEIELPETDPTGTINAVMDTFIELTEEEDTDGVKQPVANSEPKNSSNQLELKTSGSQKYIRMPIIQFNVANYDKDVASAELVLSKKSLDKQDTTISVYATTEVLPEDITWANTEGLGVDSRINKGNTDVLDWLKSIQAEKVGEMEFALDENIMEHKMNVSKFVNKDLEEENITFILLDEAGVNTYLKLYSMEEEYAPTLNIWDTVGGSDEDESEEGNLGVADEEVDATQDTYIELSSKVGNSETYNAKKTLDLKTSGGQTTIRMPIIEFDLMNSESIKAGKLGLSLASLDQDISVAVYATNQSLPADITWESIEGLNNDSRVTENKGNTDVLDWITSVGGTKVGNIDFLAAGATEYTLDASEVLNEEFNGDQVTFILIDEEASNGYLKLNSIESGNSAKLSIWNADPSEEPGEGTPEAKNYTLTFKVKDENDTYNEFHTADYEGSEEAALEHGEGLAAKFADKYGEYTYEAVDNGFVFNFEGLEIEVPEVEVYTLTFKVKDEDGVYNEFHTTDYESNEETALEYGESLATEFVALYGEYTYKAVENGFVFNFEGLEIETPEVELYTLTFKVKDESDVYNEFYVVNYEGNEETALDYGEKLAVKFAEIYGDYIYETADNGFVFNFEALENQVPEVEYSTLTFRVKDKNGIYNEFYVVDYEAKEETALAYGEKLAVLFAETNGEYMYEEVENGYVFNFEGLEVEKYTLTFKVKDENEDYNEFYTAIYEGSEEAALEYGESLAILFAEVNGDYNYERVENGYIFNFEGLEIEIPEVEIYTLTFKVKNKDGIYNEFYVFDYEGSVEKALEYGETLADLFAETNGKYTSEKVENGYVFNFEGQSAEIPLIPLEPSIPVDPEDDVDPDGDTDPEDETDADADDESNIGGGADIDDESNIGGGADADDKSNTGGEADLDDESDTNASSNKKPESSEKPGKIEDKEKPSNSKEESLPETGTKRNIYSLLGMMVLVIGAAIVVYNKKSSKE
ncbi:polysaccharide lyase family 7 protein [Jeotgalibaca sp. MA1X17-3]|uniref:polysaccharide lyase family 7 protein n=1 Tax=Jeotgalibaca sp. MA1X17-3 TaxID=2908211 RepID=UPI001F164C1D|nr:polysaccharide lyase family 7 protein [Jeotgalibaca sp. MA1X17-3]UJF16276.1 polysaccharide lyase family 7 protein [Jeotgalibaca sp. MA1X17-3]